MKKKITASILNVIIYSRYIILCFFAVLSSHAASQTIKVSCKLAKSVESLNRSITLSKASCERDVESVACRLSRESEERAKLCIQSNVDYEVLHNFIFEKSILSATEKANVTVEVLRCDGPKNTFKGTLSSTPTLISIDFAGASIGLFHIDRKDLSSGFNDQRNRMCSIEDFKIENKL